MPKSIHSQQKVDLDEFVRAELPRLYRIAQRLTATADQADDLVGITLLNAAKAWKEFDGAYPLAWLHRIMQNAYIRESQKQFKQRGVDLDLVAEQESSQNIHIELESKMQTEMILRSLSKLSAEHRVVITLCDIEELNYEEVAKVLNIPRGTLCSRLHRARKMLVSHTQVDAL